MSRELDEVMTYQQKPEHNHYVETIDNNKYWRNAIIRGLFLTGATLLTLFTVIGTAGLAFFFVKQFGIDYALPSSFIIPASFFVSSLIFSAYFSVFVLGMWKKTVNDCDESHPLEDTLHFKDLSTELKVSEELNLTARLEQAYRRIFNRKKRQEELGKTTIKQKIAQFLTGVFGITAVGFLAGGAYLGVMTVGITLSMTSVFFPLALASAFCMFCSMTMYFWDDMMTNARKMSAPQADREKMWQDKLKQLPEDFDLENMGTWARFSLIAYRIMSVGASVGFAAFKVYSSIHLAKMLGVTSPVAIAITGAVALVSMTIMTGMTSGVRIWDSGLEHAAKRDGHKIKNHLHPEHTTEHTNPFRYYASRVITFFAAAFNAIASFMGMDTLNAFVLGFIPTSIASIAFPALTVLAGFVALCRYIDFDEYYGPHIAINLGGTVYKPTEEGVQHKNSERELIRHLSQHDLKRSQSSQSLDLTSEEQQAKTYSDPIGASKTFLGRTGHDPSEVDTGLGLSGDPQNVLTAGN